MLTANLYTQNQQSRSEFKDSLKVLNNKLIENSKKTDSLQIVKDTIFAEEKIIRNEYQKTYEKIILASDSQLYSIIESLLSEHRHLDSTENK